MSQPSAPATGLMLPRRIHLPRTVGSVAGFVFVAPVLADITTSWFIWGLVLFHGFAWPHIAYLIALRSKAPAKSERRNFYVDSLHAGFWVATMQFNLLPSVLFLSVMNMNNIAGGGLGLLLGGFVMQFLGAVLSIALLGFAFSPDTSSWQMYACLPMLAIYLPALGGVTYRMATQLSQSKQRLRTLSRTDSLTQLPNHGHLNEQLDNEFKLCRAGNRSSVLALIDVDNFKAINDSYGHVVGDSVLRKISEQLRFGLRSGDQAGRYGGDEFCVLLPCTEASNANEAMERLRLSAAALRFANVPEMRITLSIGLAPYRPDMVDTTGWLKAADKALYVAKQQGRNCVATTCQHAGGSSLELDMACIR